MGVSGAFWIWGSGTIGTDGVMISLMLQRADLTLECHYFMNLDRRIDKLPAILHLPS